MNKSKFKSVKFLPFDKQMVRYFASDGKAYWEVNKQVQTMRCYESTIETYPELFEVEKAEREFEEGAWYKLHSHKYKHGYTLGYYYELLNCFYIIGTNVPHYPKDFDKIGEKIEL